MILVFGFAFAMSAIIKPNKTKGNVMRTLAYALIALAFSVSSAFAAMVRVAPSPEEATGDWAGAYTDIQAACDAASDGDTVLLKSGTYTLSGSEVKLVDRSLTVSGEAEGAVVIDGAGLSRCLSCNIASGVANKPCLIEKIVFRNGDASGSTADANYNGRGGGVYLHSYNTSSHITMRKCVIENCTTSFTTASCRGGGLYIGRYSTLEDTIVRNCSVGKGSDVYSGGGGIFSLGTDSNVRGDGPIISRCVVTNCTTASARGAGVFCYSNTYFEDCDIAFNGTTMASGSGCALYCTIGRARVLGCRFFGNCKSGSSAKGSAVFLASNMVVSNCTFTGNRSDTASLYGGGTGTQVANCIFTNDYNRAWQSEDNAVLTFRNTLFASGKTGSGQQWTLCPGGSGAEIVAENCTFANMAHALRAANASTFRCVNCIFYGNTLDFFIGASSTAATPFTLVNCCLAAYPDEGKYSASDCIVGKDPCFVSAATGDWRLKRKSPCVDKGSMSPTWLTASAMDVAGNPRVATNGKPLSTNPGAVVDIGCFENQDAIMGLSLIFR